MAQIITDLCGTAEAEEERVDYKLSVTLPADVGAREPAVQPPAVEAASPTRTQCPRARVGYLVAPAGSNGSRPASERRRERGRRSPMQDVAHEAGRTVRHALESDARTARLALLMIIAIIGCYLLF
jgi:hypothetical protein